MNWRQWIQLWGVILGVGFGSMAMAQVPGVFHFSGELDTNNGALTDTIDVQIALYDDPVLGGKDHELWAEMQTVTVTQGRFHVMLGADEINPILPSTFQKAAVYVGITVGSDSEMTPRSRVGTVPYATLAGDAATLGGVSASSYVTQAELNSAGYVTGVHTVDTFRSDADILAVVGPHTTDTTRSDEEIQNVVAAMGIVSGGQNCEVGQVVQNIGADGTIECITPTPSVVPSKPILSKVSSGNTTSQSWVEIAAIEPLKSGNRLTPTSIKVDGYTNIAWGSNYKGYLVVRLYYGDDTSSDYASVDFYNVTSNTQQAVLSIPAYAGFRGDIIKIALRARRGGNVGSAYYVYGTMTVDGFETVH